MSSMETRRKDLSEPAESEMEVVFARTMIVPSLLAFMNIVRRLLA